MKVGEYIKKARLSAGITQTELAKRLTTTPQNISQYETGKRIPKLSTLEKLSEAIGIPLVSKIIHSSLLQIYKIKKALEILKYLPGFYPSVYTINCALSLGPAN